MTKAEAVELYNAHAEARGDLRPIGPRSKLTRAQVLKKLAKVLREADSWTDM